MDFIAATPADTERLAASLAPRLQPRDVVFLQGDLGLGKSVFARALIRTLCDDPGLEVPSPTFTLVQSYDTTQGPLWHFDLYRVKTPDEIDELGWDDARHDAIVVVEWPARLPVSSIPPDRLDIVFASGNDGARLITVTGYGAWEGKI